MAAVHLGHMLWAKKKKKKKYMDWIYLAQDGDECQALANMITNVWIQ